MNDDQIERAVLKYLHEDYGENRRFQSLSTLFEKVMRPRESKAEGFDLEDEIDTKEELRAFLDDMVQDGRLESRRGERDYESSYRLTDEGAYEASGFDQYVIEQPSIAEEIGDDSSTHDSASWTGTQHVLVDAKVLRRARQCAENLRRAVYAYHTPNNSLSSDLKTLVDALIQLLEMCEPELGPIERILASPKFRASAVLVAAVATVRGALGV